MNAEQIYTFARSKGCSTEKATELAISNYGKSNSEVEEIVALAVLAPVAGAMIVDDALCGVPSSIARGILGLLF